MVERERDQQSVPERDRGRMRSLSVRERVCLCESKTEGARVLISNYNCCHKPTSSWWEGVAWDYMCSHWSKSETGEWSKKQARADVPNQMTTC